VTHWDNVKERILLELKKQKGYKQLSFDGKTRNYTVEFFDGKKFQFPFDRLKELPF